MKNTLRKLAVLLMALMLVIPQTLVFAEETTGAPEAMTVKAEYSIDKDALADLLPMLGVPDEGAKIINLAAAVLSATSEKLTAADNGMQLDLNLNGSDIYSMAGEFTEEGISIASTLLPNYVVTASSDSIMELMQKMMFMGQNASDSNAGGSGMDMASACTQALTPYLTEFIETCSSAAVPGEPESAEFTYKDITFNTKVPIKYDMDAIIKAEEKLVEQVLTDEAILPVLEMTALYSGKSFDAEAFLKMNHEIMSSEYIPDVDISFYTNVDEEGNQSDVYCVVSEATYKGTQETASRFTFLSQGTVGEMTLEIPEIQAAMTYSYEMTETGMTMRMDYSMQGMYFGIALDLVYGNDIVMNYDLFFQDEQNPLAHVTVTVSPDGERTLSTSAEGKNVLTLEDLMGENGGEAMNSLVGDIMANGLGSLFASASSALPEAGELISLLMGGSNGSDGAGPNNG